MTLSVDVRHTFGSFSLNASFVSQGGVTALFGRSGSGKTSLLRIIAGLSVPDSGRVAINDEIVLDTQQGIFVPKHRRRLGYVFQEGRLFPHLSVRQNLDYGRWFCQPRARWNDFNHVVELLGLERLLDRRPAHLSGGEKQRVAIGRALLCAPRLLLMDEPLASLDDERKAEILPYLERLHDESGTPIVYVSHSVSEVVRLADWVVRVRDGTVEASGTPAEMFGESAYAGSDPRDAGSVLTGVVESVDERHRLATIQLSKARIVVPAASVRQGRPVRLHIPERDVLVATRWPEGLSALNILQGKIISLEKQGEAMVRVRIGIDGDAIVARITSLSAERLGLVLEMPVFAIIKTVALEG